MAINANSSQENVLNESKLYTGLALMKVVAINPTKDELAKLYNADIKQEPTYFQQKDDGIHSRIEVHFANEALKITAKATFFMKDKEVITKTGKVAHINKYGEYCFFDGDIPSYGSFRNEEVRKAYDGEEDLMGFIKAWANTKREDPCYFEDPEAIVKGNVSELKELVGAIKDNQVMCLLGVRDGRYQGIYTRYFARSYQTNTAPWLKKIEGYYGSFYKHDWQDSLEFKEYAPTEITKSDNLEVATESTQSTEKAPW